MQMGRKPLSEPHARPHLSLVRLFLMFLTLGVVACGGPAMVAYIRQRHACLCDDVGAWRVGMGNDSAIGGFVGETEDTSVGRRST
jgi:hypothetical protein